MNLYGFAVAKRGKTVVCVVHDVGHCMANVVSEQHFGWVEIRVELTGFFGPDGVPLGQALVDLGFACEEIL